MASYYSEPYLRTTCPVHNQWIEAVWNLAASDLRISSWKQFKHQIVPSRYKQFLDDEYFIWHSWAGLASEARSVLSLEAFYN